MKKDLFFGIPVYNEESNLKKTLNSLNKEVINLNINVKTFLCINGCTDNSLNIAKKCKKRFLRLNITILESEIGKLNAQKKIVSFIPKQDPICFLDADIILKKNCLKNILMEMKTNKELIVVGAFPVAKTYLGKNIWKRI